MDQPLSFQPSGDLHLSGYEDKQHGTLLFSQNRRFVPHSPTSNITSLLQTSSSPQTESSISQGTQMLQGQLPVSGDVFLENRSSQNRKKQKTTTPSPSKTQNPQKRQRYKAKPALVKKRGELRDAESPSSGVPEDVR
jgi:hypothetical protein